MESRTPYDELELPCLPRDERDRIVRRGERRLLFSGRCWLGYVCIFGLAGFTLLLCIWIGQLWFSPPHKAVGFILISTFIVVMTALPLLPRLLRIPTLKDFVHEELQSRGLCMGCGYIMRGMPEDENGRSTCPECGGSGGYPRRDSQPLV